MSDRSPGGGPILRKRGARQQDGEQTAPKPAERQQPPQAAPPTRGGHGEGGGRPSPDRPRFNRAQGGGRRLYDPNVDAARPRPSVEGDPARAASDMKGFKKPAGGPKKGRGAPAPSEKDSVREEAQKLAREKGVPIVHAYRILKGQATLNDVLKAMMRKERFEQLIHRDGIDRELAGQVASGNLPKQRAMTLTRMRTLRGPKLHVDAITAAAADPNPVAIAVFGGGWLVGRVKNARLYDFDFLIDGAGAPMTFYKHDVKALCAASELEAAKGCASMDEGVAGQGLKGTEDRAARVRPEDEWMLRLVEDERVVRFTMRDGEAYVGQLRSFGRWDGELVLPGGECVSVFFHALHPLSATLGLKE
ncbi:MAG: hypothetical protein KC635_10410 [Myxococcales bacterium]|nr:hypothetical protein [Myxococcales bacterium]MCB9735704.1 hypothetical protein [Deltaproteobacteria bacterium]